MPTVREILAELAKYMQRPSVSLTSFLFCSDFSKSLNDHFPGKGKNARFLHVCTLIILVGKALLYWLQILEIYQEGSAALYGE